MQIFVFVKEIELVE